jgi:hypothetical protein
MLTRRSFYVIIAVVFGLLCAVGLLSLPAIAQAPTPSTSSSNNTSPNSAILPSSLASPNVVLYNQYDHPSASSYSSQNFEPSLDGYDDFVADDFIVPAGQKWSINQVDVLGAYFNGSGPAASMNVFIYTEAITLPGTLLDSRTNLSFTSVYTNFAITISPTIMLPTGKYWLSVQANENFDPNGQWGWTGRTITSNYPAAWQNPGGGFGSQCTSWKLRSSCIGGVSAPDQVFRLSGTISHPPLTCGNPGPWILRNFLPVPAYGTSVANDGVSAYVIGGYSFQTASDITQTVRYAPTANTWTALAPVPHEVTMASAVYVPVNKKIYVFGGQKTSVAQVFNSTLIYDIGSNTWTTGAPMPDVRAFMASGYYNGKVYLVGGYSTGSVTPAFAQVWEYDVLANTWTTKTSMPEALGGAASAVVNGHLYVIGGRDGSTSARNQTYDYNIALDSWSVRAAVPYGVNVPGGAVLDGKVWVIGGGTPFLGLNGLSSLAGIDVPNTLATTLIYDPAPNSWVSGPVLNIQRSFVGATGFGNLAIAIGGYDGSTTNGATEVTCFYFKNNLPFVKR